MEISAYQQAFTRIHAEYLEMPGMRLTPPQIQRLCGVEISICTLVLDDGAGEVSVPAPDESYVRRSDGFSSFLGANAGLNPNTRVPVTRRAS